MALRSYSSGNIGWVESVLVECPKFGSVQLLEWLYQGLGQSALKTNEILQFYYNEDPCIA